MPSSLEHDPRMTHRSTVGGHEGAGEDEHGVERRCRRAGDENVARLHSSDRIVGIGRDHGTSAIRLGSDPDASTRIAGAVPSPVGANVASTNARIAVDDVRSPAGNSCGSGGSISTRASAAVGSPAARSRRARRTSSVDDDGARGCPRRAARRAPRCGHRTRERRPRDVRRRRPVHRQRGRPRRSRPERPHATDAGVVVA